MSIKFKPDSTLSAEPFPSAPAEKNIITLLGVQGLSHNDYSIVELKVMLQLIKHAQKVIVNYVIPQRVSHNGFYFTSEQLAAGHTIVEMKLSELDITGGKHCAQLWRISGRCVRIQGIYAGRQAEPYALQAQRKV